MNYPRIGDSMNVNSQVVVLRPGDRVMERLRDALKPENGPITILDIRLLKIAAFSITCEVEYSIIDTLTLSKAEARGFAQIYNAA